MAHQKGLYRSIEDEKLQPQEHLDQAPLLRLSDGPSSVGVPDVVERAINAYASSSLVDLQRRRKEAIAHRSAVTSSLPRVEDEPFHTALVKAMDRELDLLDREPGRGRVPLEPVQVAGYGAAVTGVAAHDQVFKRRAKIGPEPGAPGHVVRQPRKGTPFNRRRGREGQGGGQGAHVEGLVQGGPPGVWGGALVPPSANVPNVFYPRFIAEHEKWDTEGWLHKPRPVDDATSNGVNGALQVLSHTDCHALDRFAESASLFMRRSREHGYCGGFSCLVFDHDEAYRRVKRQCAFRALVPVVSLGDVVPMAGSEVFVPEGQIVYLEMWRLLFGEAGSVPGYCCVARVIVVVL